MCTKRVLITGFGPFCGVEVNASWEGVNAMNREEIECKHNIHLYQEKIDVDYNNVDYSVPKLWQKLQPDLVIHVGVAGVTSFLLETQASKDGYEIPDASGTCPVDNRHWSDGPGTITTELDVDKLCEEFNKEPPADGLEAQKSYDAGKFLCEYTYYTSLICSSKTLFVHIPAEKYTYDQIALGLERILAICLGQIGD